jgi:hypothetical protein
MPHLSKNLPEQRDSVSRIILIQQSSLPKEALINCFISLACRKTGKAKRTRQQQSANPDGYIAALLYPPYADFLFKEALFYSSYRRMPAWQ